MICEILILGFFVCFSQSQTENTVELSKANACMETLAEPRQRLALIYTPQFDDKPPLLRAVASVNVTKNGEVIHSVAVEYWLRYVSGTCNSTLPFSDEEGKYPGAEFVFKMSFFTAKNDESFSDVEFTAMQPLTAGKYELRDNQELLSVILDFNPKQTYILLKTVNVQLDYYDLLSPEMYDQKCACAMHQGKKYDLRLVDDGQLMRFEGAYSIIEMKISIQDSLTYELTEFFSVRLSAFPCRCKTTSNFPQVTLVLTTDYNFYRLSVSLNNLYGVMENKSYCTFFNYNSIFDFYESTFDISNLRMLQTRPYNLDLNDPNYIIMFELKEDVDQCKNDQYATKISKRYEDKVIEFSLVKLHSVEPGKLVQRLEYRSTDINACG